LIINSLPKIICLTPVKNEAWILDSFLKCASLWADKIIIADQGSDDDSREIARNYPKVILINNPAENFSEEIRQKVLIDESRKIDGNKILIALDADEFLTSNFLASPEWQKVINCEIGTVIKFKFVNITPDFLTYWMPQYEMPWGFHDDGSNHLGQAIHSFRIPIPDNSPTLLLDEIKVMHFQYTDWQRMESKHRWYQCWERINNPKKSAIEIYRGYHHMYSVKKEDLKVLPGSWFEDYEKLGINIIDIKKDINYYWDKKILAYFAELGTGLFFKESIWDIDWTKKANSYKLNSNDRYKDPRNIFIKLVHFWLRQTQPFYKKFFIRGIDKLLKTLFGW
jgi:hypothetical protein